MQRVTQPSSTYWQHSLHHGSLCVTHSEPQQPQQETGYILTNDNLVTTQQHNCHMKLIQSPHILLLQSPDSILNSQVSNKNSNTTYLHGTSFSEFSVILVQITIQRLFLFCHIYMCHVLNKDKGTRNRKGGTKRETGYCAKNVVPIYS